MQVAVLTVREAGCYDRRRDPQPLRGDHVGTLPILAVYPFLQRSFIKGVMIGALKG